MSSVKIVWVSLSIDNLKWFATFHLPLILVLFLFVIINSNNLLDTILSRFFGEFPLC